VNAATGGTIFGAHGVEVSFIPNAFVTSAGTSASGTIDVELVEVLDIPSMILMNKQAMGDDDGTLKPLVSGGQIKLIASLAGELLELVDNGSLITFPASGGADPSMEVFYGTEATDGVVTWTPAPLDVTIYMDSGSVYQFFNDSLEWVNCDYFYEPGATMTDVVATPPAGHDETNTVTWIVFTDNNAVANLYHWVGGSLTTAPFYQLPVGLNITIVSLAAIGSEYRSCFVSTTISAGMNIPLSYNTTTLEQFEIDAQDL